MELNNDKYNEEVLSESMIANARLLSNNKYEFDSIMMLYNDRLKIIPRGLSRISKRIKSMSFNDRYLYRIFSLEKNYNGIKDDFRKSIFEISEITTSLFSYSTKERDYNGLEQIVHSENGDYSIGNGLNYIINTLYTLMASFTKFNSELSTPNDLIYKDIINNMRNDQTLCDIDLYTFNLVRLLIIVSNNMSKPNFDRIIINKKSPINYRVYNYGGDNVVINDLLYAGKYGKASYEYSKTFNKYLGNDNAFEDLLKAYDYVIDRTRKGLPIDKHIVKEIIKTVYLYYGAKYLKLKDNNSFTQKELDIYKIEVMKAFEIVIRQYNISFNKEDLSFKESYEKTIENSHLRDNKYYKLPKVKESFEPHEKVPMIANNKVRELKLKYNLEN